MDPNEVDPLTPHLTPKDRKLLERAVRQLQAHGVVADFDGDDTEVTELFRWSEKNQPLLEAYFRFAGIGLRAHPGLPVLQLVLDDADPSHPLRQRFDKAETGLLICLWILYHERARETEGFIIPVTVEEIYARLSALYSTDKEVPEGVFRAAIQRFSRHSLVQTDWLSDEFLQSRIGLLPTLLTTFQFQDAAQALGSVKPKSDAPTS